MTILITFIQKIGLDCKLTTNSHEKERATTTSAKSYTCQSNEKVWFIRLFECRIYIFCEIWMECLSCCLGFDYVLSNKGNTQSQHFLVYYFLH